MGSTITSKPFFEDAKKDILEKAKTSPEILKSDPIWNEKLKTADGFMEYINSRDIDMTPETFMNYPEINQIFLDTDPEEVLKSFSDLYFAGIIDEDNMRSYPHYASMKEYLKTFQQELDQTRTVTNEMWVTKLKDDTFNYIKLVLSPEFQKESLSYAKTTDNMRVDLGLVISRDPIFVE
jgi:hypothetical protein